MNREITEADTIEVFKAGIGDTDDEYRVWLLRAIDDVNCWYRQGEKGGIRLYRDNVRENLVVSIVHSPEENFINICVPDNDDIFCHLKAIQKAAALGLVTLEPTEAEAVQDD